MDNVLQRRAVCYILISFIQGWMDLSPKLGKSNNNIPLGKPYKKFLLTGLRLHILQVQQAG